MVFCGENGYAAAGEKIKAAMGDFPHEFMMFHSTCCLENADETAAYINEKGFDLLAGVGGVMAAMAKMIEITPRFERVIFDAIAEENWQVITDKARKYVDLVK